MPFGCQVGCTVSEYHTVEPLPVEEREPKDVCPPGMPNKWDIDDIPHAEGYCEGQGMDCVCNPMAIVTGIPCYKTIYVDSLPEEGMSGVMYVTPQGDKYAVYMWDGAEFYSVTPSATLVPLTVTPSTSAQDIDPTDADGFSHVHVDAEAMGALAPPTIEFGANLGSGVIWAHSSVGVGGYIQQGESIDGFEYCSRILPTENGKTVTPTTSEQVAVAANKWTNGQIKVGPIPSEYIIPTGTKQINANGTGIDVAAYEKVDVNVAASGKAVQIDNTNHRIASTAYVDTGAKITVTKAGTYTVYYSAFRSSTSGTSGTQLYKNGVAQGTANTTWENSYCQSPHTTMTLAADDVITVYARSRNTSYYTCVSNLTIVEQ